MARVHQHPGDPDTENYQTENESPKWRRSEASHLEPERQRSKNLADGDAEGSHHLKPQRHSTITRSVSSLWTSTLKRTVGETDNSRNLYRNRYLVIGQINALGHRKYNLNSCSTIIGGVSLVVLLLHMELRMREDEDEEPGQACNVLRGIELALTVALVLSSAFFHLTHHQILNIIGAAGYVGGHKWLSFWSFALLETLVLIVGVMPPGIESSVTLPLTPEANEVGMEDVVRHIDCYCLLQMLRIPLFVKWVSVAWLAHVKSPAVLAWEHGVNVDVHASL